MAREKIKLSIEKHGDKIRYKRMVKGQLFKSTAFANDTRENKSKAWQEFVTWRKAIPAKQPPSPPDNLAAALIQRQLVPLIEHAELTGDPERATKLRQLSKQAPTMDSEDLHIFLAYLVGEVNGVDHKPMFKDRAATVKRIKADQLPELEAGALSKTTITRLETRAKAGMGSEGAVNKIRSALDRFVNWYGASRSLQNIDEKVVRDYTTYLESLVESGKLAQSSASGYQSEFRTWITQLGEDYPEIPLPKNLRSKSQRIHTQRKEPITFSLPEIKLLLAHATPRTKLYLLLMLNCGMYQGDLSDLLATEVDWDAGRIVRPRSKIKRRNDKSVPRKVNWKLWPETWKLFEQLALRDGRCLVTDKGNPLVTYKGKIRSDAVKSAYRRLIEKLKRRKLLPTIWDKTPKSFRKTGTNLLEKSAEHGIYYNLYLNSSVAKQNYLTSGDPVPSFDAAIEWLGKQILSD